MRARPLALKETQHPVCVWDWPIRLFHWAIVGLTASLYITAKEGGDWMEYHELAGYIFLTLVLFRLLWGLWGSQHARFSDFCYRPRTVFQYLRTLFTPSAKRYLGHNPLGSISVLLMLTLLLVLAVTGLFATDDVMLEGPLVTLISKETSDLLTFIHGWSFDALLIAIVVHVMAVLFYLVIKRENLVIAMLTGKKHVAVVEDTSHKAPLWLAIFTLAVVVLGVLAMISAPSLFEFTP